MKRILTVVLVLFIVGLSALITGSLWPTDHKQAPEHKPGEPVQARDERELNDLVQHASFAEETVIALLPGTYHIPTRISLPPYSHVRIIGNGAAINAPKGGFYASNAQLSISDVTFIGTWDRTPHGQHQTAVVAAHQAYVTCTRLTVKNCYHGLTATDHAYMDCEMCSVINAGDGGFFCYAGSHMDCNDCRVDGAGDPYSKYSQILGTGYIAEIGSSMNINRSTASNFLLAGFESIGAHLRAHNCVASDSERGSGFVSVYGGHLEMGGSDSAYRVKWGVWVDVGGIATDRAYYDHQIPRAMYDFKNIYCHGGHVVFGRTKLDGKVYEHIYR
jgi:hypothetical protein